MTQVLLVYVPCASEEQAAAIGTALVEERLIACANIYQSRSIYKWKGELQDEPEYLLLCKTARSRVQAAQKRIQELHSYEVPCILRIEPPGANREYEAWVLEQVSETWSTTEADGLALGADVRGK